MARLSAAASGEQTLYAALELSKNSWLLAIQFPDRDKLSLHPIKGGDTDGLMTKLDAARQRLGKVLGRKPKLRLCYEEGYDGFWLPRFLEHYGIDCLLIEPASLQVNHRARRAKTDRIDVEKLLRTLIAWCAEAEYHPYGTAKAAIIHYTRELAQELGPYSINVNCVAPGHIRTGRFGDRTRFENSIPLWRSGTIEDCAKVVAFFSADLSDYAAGSTMVIDGGFLN